MNTPSSPADNGQWDSPGPAPWASAAIRLLQGAVYHDQHRQSWQQVMDHQAALTDYFAKIALQLVVDSTDGMAYLRQRDAEDLEDSSLPVPRLFRRTQMTYSQSLVCVLLRDMLCRFELEELQDDRCVIRQRDLLDLWAGFFPADSDSIILNRQLGTILRRLEEMKLVRQVDKSPPTWEIRRILKARLPVEELERLRNLLQTHSDQLLAGSDSPTGESDDPAGQSAEVQERS